MTTVKARVSAMVRMKDDKAILRFTILEDNQIRVTEIENMVFKITDKDGFVKEYALIDLLTDASLSEVYEKKV